MESPEAPSHIAGLTILDPSTSPEFSFDRYLEILAERIGLVARFKWKLLEVPFGIDRGYWISADDFDVVDHVHRIALPNPGGQAELANMAGFLHAKPLDRKRPLWECWWIEGLSGGRIATLLKIHHCLMDGQSGIGLSEILMDLSPEPNRDLQVAAQAREREPRPPDLWELGRAALVNGLNRPGRMAQHASRALREGLVKALDGSSERTAPEVPRVPFNARLGPERAFAFTSVPLAPLRDLRKHLDVKLNDVLLALVSSAVRRCLVEQRSLPAAPVVALCPVSLREEGDSSFGNQLSSMPVSLATDVDDPIERLLTIHRGTDAAKRRMAGGAFEMLTALGESFVPGALRYVAKAAHGLSSRLPLPANFVFSNVRALPVSLYLAGAKVEGLYPMSMLQVANGLNVTAVSHGDKVDFGFLVDSSLIRDPWVYAEGIPAALAELEEAFALRTREERASAARALAETSSSPPPSQPSPSRPARPGWPPVVPHSAMPANGSLRSDALEGQEGDRDEHDLIDLHLIMAGLDHLRSPSRTGLTDPDAVDDPPDS